MPARADTKLPEAVVCDLAGCAQPTRQSWVKRGLLSPARGGCTTLDLIELHVLGKLLHLIGPRDTGFVWQDLRAQLRGSSMTGDLVDVVVDLQSKRAVLAQDVDAVLVGVRTERLTRVIPIADDVARLRADFRRLAGLAGTATRAKGRQKRAYRRGTGGTD